ncbi:hypothetical protein [Clostridium butyricum]|uniref:hypothetical protein n=1 Tax=Clostridium butyricum TaxID=1492 RepID=UPI002ABD9FC7|nr:hypothetical protein [Clostridium butyricum]
MNEKEIKYTSPKENLIDVKFEREEPYGENIEPETSEGIDVVIIDPENEYKELAKVLNSNCKIANSIDEIENINPLEIKESYIYEFFGDFWVNNRNYQIEVGMPTKYKTIEEAKGDNSSLRFEKHDEHIVLVIYSNWKQGMISGKWHENVAGEVLDIIKWEDWYRYKISMAKEQGIEGVGDSDSGYVPSATNWDELFDVKNKEDTWGCTVESLAYSICKYFN